MSPGFGGSCLMCFLICMAGLMLQAQQIPLFTYSYTTDNGLISNKDNDFFTRDKQGNIWISNLNGLVRYDGSVFQTHKASQSDAKSISQSHIQSQLFEDQDGRLWFNTKTNLEFYDPVKDEFNRVPIPNQSGFEEDFFVFHFDSMSQTVWVVGKKVNKYPLYALRASPPFDTVFVDSISAYVPDATMSAIPDDPGYLTLFIPRDQGWEFRRYQYTDNTWKKAGDRVQETELSPFCLYAPASDSIWVGTNEGLVLTQATPSGFAIVSPHLKNIKGVIPYDHEKLLIGTKSDGIYFLHTRSPFKTDSVSFYGVDARPIDRIQIRAMHLDQKENLWISTETKGIYMHPVGRRQFDVFGLDQHSVKGIAQDHKGINWLLTPKGILRQSNGGKIHKEHPLDSSLNSTVFSNYGYYLTNDREGNIWVCTLTGLYVKAVNEDRFNKVPFLEDEEDNSWVFTYFLQTNDGERVAVTHGVGIYSIKKKSGRFYIDTENPVTSTGNYMFAFENSQGELMANLWPKGLVVFKKSEDGWRAFPDTLPHSSMVYGMVEQDSLNRTWMGSQEGLFMIKSDSGHYEIVKDLDFAERYQIVNSLFLDKNDQLWLSTEAGLVHYVPHTGKKAISNKPLNVFFHFDQSDGLASNEFHSKSYLRSNNGQVLLGSPSGLIKFDPLKINFNKKVHAPRITQILINQNLLDQQRINKRVFFQGATIPSLELDDSVKTLAIHFVNNEEYGDKQTFRFRYVLTDESGGIIKKGDESIASFVNMKPGVYYLEMYTTNSQQYWGPAQTMQLKFRPHWAETIWFRGFLIIAGLLIIILVYRNRLRMARNEKEIAESRQRAAERDLKDTERDLRDLEVKEVIRRLQMNPHFIFNGLTSIQSYIVKKDVDIATDFLGRFAELMRMVLDRSEESNVSLEDELSFLDAYLDIEALRYEHAFSYEFILPDTVFPDQVFIPPMLLQPFVENAVLHGVRGIDYPGKIEVSFAIVEEQLHCTVQDNGVGMQAKPSKSPHKSKAIAITRQRLGILESQMETSTSLEIGPSRFSSGTKVHITLPLL